MRGEMLSLQKHCYYVPASRGIESSGPAQVSDGQRRPTKRNNSEQFHTIPTEQCRKRHIPKDRSSIFMNIILKAHEPSGCSITAYKDGRSLKSKCKNMAFLEPNDDMEVLSAVHLTKLHFVFDCIQCLAATNWGSHRLELQNAPASKVPCWPKFCLQASPYTLWCPQQGCQCTCGVRCCKQVQTSCTVEQPRSEPHLSTCGHARGLVT